MKITSWIVLLGALLFSYPAHADITPPPAPTVVKVGVQLPLSGDLSAVGEDIRRGMELALEELTTSSPKLIIVYQDDQARAASAASVARHLLDIEKVDVLVSLWDIADIVAPLTDRAKVPHISIRWNLHVTEKHPYTFTFESTYRSYAIHQLKLIRAMGAKKIALLSDESQGFQLARSAQTQFAAEFGLHIVGDESFTFGAGRDLRPEVLKVLAHQPDVLVLNCFQPGLDVAVRRIREVKPSQKFTGYFEGVMPRAMVSEIPFIRQSNPMPWFSEKFERRYGEPFKIRAPHGYDIVNLLAKAYNSSPQKLSPVALIAWLKGLKDYPGASGMLSTSPTKNIETDTALVIFKDDRILPLTLEQVAAHGGQFADTAAVK